MTKWTLYLLTKLKVFLKNICRRNDMKTTKEKAIKLFGRVNTFILSCVDEDGFPMTKAVVPGKTRDNFEEMYFCTNTSSKFANAVDKNSKTGVYFFSRKLIWKGCFLKGKMEIVSDMDVKKQLWQNKFKKAYKEQSFTDPDFCVLKFVAEKGRFYSWFKPEDFDI